jgi:ABC-type glutathione transport system ATPase component
MRKLIYTEGGPAAVRALSATKRYGTGAAAVTALDNVAVTIPAGLLTAVLGPSGSGKSTLLHCLAGLATLDSGEVAAERDCRPEPRSTRAQQECRRARRDKTAAGGMPAFGGRLRKAQIDALATYVAGSTRRK